MNKSRLIGMMDGIISGCTLDETRKNRAELAERILAAIQKENKQMKIKISVTERALPADNQFLVGPSKEKREEYNEVCVRAYTTGIGIKGESVTMSFPRHRGDYPNNHPEVVAAIEKCRQQTTASLQGHLDAKAKGTLDNRKIKI